MCDVFVRDNEAVRILRKVLAQSETSIADLCLCADKRASRLAVELSMEPLVEEGAKVI